MAESAYDQREQAARTAEAQLVAARDGLKVAEAEKAQIEAQRRELNWRRGRTEVVAPADGIISRRMARVGGYAAGAAEPMFRIVANGEVELDAEVTETRMAGVKDRPACARRGRRASARSPATCGWSRPRSTRRPGSAACASTWATTRRCASARFARGTIETANEPRPRRAGLRHPLRARRRRRCRWCATTASRRAGSRSGLPAGALVEVREGLSEGDLVVARSGTFLRDGDAVRPRAWPRPRSARRTR